MPCGTSDSKLTNKTEFMRWLDAHPGDITPLAPKLRFYRTTFPRGITFGLWLRQRHLKAFVLQYQKFWLKHPELYQTTYQQV